jgi:hypothetical protein
MQMMLGIFVYSQTTVTLGSAVDLEMFCAGKAPQTTANTIGDHVLQPGIYRIVKANRLVFSAGRECEIVILDDKDPYPDPKISRRFASTFANVSAEDLADFFPRLARGYTLPSGSTSNGTASEHK